MYIAHNVGEKPVGAEAQRLVWDTKKA